MKRFVVMDGSTALSKCGASLRGVDDYPGGSFNN
jgi:hypothetical protein